MKEKSFEETIIDLAADTVMTTMMIYVAGKLIGELARDLDADEAQGIIDQLNAIWLYKEQAMIPEV